MTIELVRGDEAVPVPARRAPARIGSRLLLLLGLAATAPATIAAPGADRFIVGFEPVAAGPAAAAHARVLDEAGRANGVRLRSLRAMALGAEVVHSDRELSPEQADRLLARLRQDPRVAFAEPDARLRPAFYPNDWYLNLQWNLRDTDGGIDAFHAWDVSAGLGVVVGVLDTGIVPHFDLDANIVAGFDFVSDPAVAGDGDGRDGNAADAGDWTAAGECGVDEPATTSSWHGTRVAGVIAAVTNNDAGLAGVAFRTKAMPLRVSGKCGGALSDTTDALVWAAGGSVPGVPANGNPVEIVNLSLSGAGACPASMQAAIDAAVAAGVVVVVGAGNDAGSAADFFPGNCERVINVGASSFYAYPAYFNNGGARLDLIAPGNGIYTIGNYGTTVPANPSYTQATGTSYGAAHAAGVAAQMQALKVNPPATVEAILKGTAFHLPEERCSTGLCGAGLLDAGKAVRSATEPKVFIIDPPVVVEGTGGTVEVVFTVRLSQPLAVPVSFDASTASGTATSGTDFVPVALTGETFAPGQTQRSIVVQVIGDSVVEPTETLFLNLTNLNGMGALDAQGQASIENDDRTHLVNGIVSRGWSGCCNVRYLFDYQVPVGAAEVYFELPQGFGYYFSLGVTLNGANVCVANQTFRQCKVTAPAAGLYELVLTEYSQFTDVGVLARHNMATLSAADTTLVEADSGTRSAAIQVTLSKPVHDDIVFAAATEADTATGSDFEAKQWTGVTIPAGQTSTTLAVDTFGDTVPEPNEAFRVRLSQSNGPTIPDPLSGVFLLNNDGPTLSVGDMSTSEGTDGTKLAVFTVSLSQAAAVPVTFSFATADGSATAGSDYIARTLVNQTIPAGMLSRTIWVTLNGDALVEPTEYFHADLSNASGATILKPRANGFVINDDGALISINDVAIGEGASGVRQMTFTVSLSQPAPGPVDFNIATVDGNAVAGSDYVAINYTAQRIPAGQTAKTYAITVYGDTAVEETEVFLVNVRQPVGASIVDGQGTGFILNDDGPTLSIADASVGEGSSGSKLMNVTVQLSQVSANDVTFSIATANVSATAGSDYSALNLTNQTIVAGQTGKVFQVPVAGDTTVEANETFTVTLGSPTGATLYDRQAIATIYNDDGPTLSVSDVSISEGNSGTKEATFTVFLSQVASVPITYNVATSNVSATAGSDYVAKSLSNETIPAGQLSKTFTVTLNGDTGVEANETFRVTLSNISAGATLFKYTGTGTITNDD